MVCRLCLRPIADWFRIDKRGYQARKFASVYVTYRSSVVASGAVLEMAPSRAVARGDRSNATERVARLW